MKRLALLATAAAIVTSAGFAMAATNVAGTIVSVDSQTHQLVLDDGKTYNVASNVTLEGLRPGDKVSVSAELRNGSNVVDKIEQTGTPFTGPPAGTATPPGAPSSASSLAPPSPRQ